MTDQNQQPSGEMHDKTEGGGNAHRNRRNRHHRHHNKPPRQNAAEREAVSGAEVTATPTESAPATAEHPEQQAHHKKDRNRNRHGRKNHDGANRENGGNSESNGDNNPNHGKKERSGDKGQRGGNRRFSREKRPYDPYEEPSKQEIELSQLRAQIVLKSADGSVPTAFGAQPAPAAEPIKDPEPLAEPAIESIESEAVPAEAAPDVQAEANAPVEEEPVPMIEVIGIRFRSAGKMYYFDPNGIRAKKGDSAIVETTRGPEFGDVCLENTMIRESSVVSPLRPVIRIATEEDAKQNQANREKEKSALEICQKKIEKHGLEMKLIDVQYAFDGSKLLFYFAAEGRVDFRELVKDLASTFHTRIELRQIGIRDEAKMLGGIGACGRPLCCSTFLPDFAQVSIKMAKDQGLSLNSLKISGLCGRLMCCLRYESEVYAEEIRKTPSNDTLVRTEDGLGVVIGSNPLAGTIRVVLKDNPDTAPKQYHRDQVTVLGKEKKNSDAKSSEQPQA